MRPVYLSCLLFILLAFYVAASHAQEARPIQDARLQEIKQAFDSSLFVYRFESVETPCVYIDMHNNQLADARRKRINSNYRVMPKKDLSASTDVKCLSEHCARYLRLEVEDYQADSLTITGTVEATYSYPASSIMQFITDAQGKPQRDKAFFKHLISSKGSFKLYPENDKYRIWLVLPNEPYDKGDTVYGYVEITREAYAPARQSISIYFDKMSIAKGDDNNQMFLRFSSTSQADEAQYYSVLAYFVLKGKDFQDDNKKAEAVWLENFLKEPQCLFIYTLAEEMLKTPGFRLPNTEPIPPH
jgi:hypothetical protein